MTTHTNDTADLTFQRRDLRRATIAMSGDSARSNLCQLRIEPDGVVIATDGHRLHMLSDVVAGALPTEAIQLPGRLLDLLLEATKGYAADYVLAVRVDSDGKAHAYADGLELSAHCGDHTFPPYRQIADAIKRTDEHEGTAKALRAAIKSGTHRRDLGEAQATTDVIALTADGPVSPEGAPADAPQCNARYLLEALTGLNKGAKVQISWSGSLEPIEVEAGGICAIVMPVRPS